MAIPRQDCGPVPKVIHVIVTAIDSSQSRMIMMKSLLIRGYQ